jgi:NAD(P)H-flavin reductase
MICAGTGITPIYQILQKIVDNKEDIRVDILYVNKTENDVLLQDEIECMCMQNHNITSRYYFTRNPERVNPPFFSGRPTEKTITEFGGYDLAVICGPTGFSDIMQTICEDNGYKTLIF